MRGQEPRVAWVCRDGQRTRGRRHGAPRPRVPPVAILPDTAVPARASCPRAARHAAAMAPAMAPPLPRYRPDISLPWPRQRAAIALPLPSPPSRLFATLAHFHVDSTGHRGYTPFLACRDVAQPGSAPEWGSGGRRFKSSHPDQFRHAKAVDRKIGGLLCYHQAQGLSPFSFHFRGKSSVSQAS